MSITISGDLRDCLVGGDALGFAPKDLEDLDVYSQRCNIRRDTSINTLPGLKCFEVCTL